ncbi:MAG: hypothetical protein QOC64_3113, partial [Solirubrobacteraceae bacterium]|nr:hypothetical protein [Solirubrobacteraceae bacterium]
MAHPGQPPPAGGSDDASDLDAAIRALWHDAQPRALARVESVEEAIAALLGGALEADLAEHARREAHKLAGALGTFGMPDGTEHARAVERRLEAGAGAADAPELAHHATELRRIVEAGPASSPLPAEPGAPAAPSAPAPAPTGAGDVLLVGVDPSRAAGVAGALRARGVDATTDEHAAAQVALVAGAGSALAGDVRRLAGRGARVAALLPPDGSADRVELVRCGAARMLPASLGADALAEELAALVALRRDRVDRVLVVDDDPDILAGVRDVLTAAGHEVTTLEDPRGFWGALERTRPSLVVLDVDMPAVDGVALCRTLRADAAWGATPILFLTGGNAPATVGELFAAGADDYVAKPFHGPELAARVGNRLERTRLLRAARTTDPVTGLELRGPAHVRLQRLRGHAERLGQPLTLGLVEIEALGGDVEAADAALAGAGRALRGARAPEDVGARWGDAQLLAGQLGLGEHDAREVLAAVLEELRGAGLDAAAGIAQYPRDGADLAAVIEAARGAAATAARGAGDRLLAHGWDAAQPDRADIVLVEDD